MNMAADKAEVEQQVSEYCFATKTDFRKKTKRPFPVEYGETDAA
ncbi:hypothetical protein J3D43_005973 [Paenibacillus xylanexedens]|nr:hypothetical protein [Paenibacillus xylanexedens]MCP1427457.1 hypothetical protein [Paenibacillus xylanexedens]